MGADVDVDANGKAVAIEDEAVSAVDSYVEI